MKARISSRYAFIYYRLFTFVISIDFRVASLIEANRRLLILRHYCQTNVYRRQS